MEQKAKLIIVGLAIFTLVCLFLFIQASSGKQNLIRERNDLKAENLTLNAKVEKLTSAIRGYETKITSLNQDFENITAQREELEKKYAAAVNEKENLDRKLRELASSQETLAQREAVPQTDDEYWAGILKAKGDLELQLSSLRSEFKSLQITNEQLQREKESFGLDLNNLKRENEDLRRQADYNQKLMDSIAQELVREKNDKAQVQNNYKMVKSENSLLTRQVQSLNSRKISLDKKIKELGEGKDSLERRISEMEKMLSSGVAQMDNLNSSDIKSGASSEAVNKGSKRESVELPAIVVRPQSEGMAGKATSAPGAGLASKILAVNRDNGFVIIDSGQDAGLKIGDSFKVYRGERPIASIEVIQVRRNISACDIKREAETVKIGDVAR
jgi:septal ring factor EnvC (AmiA/AmiB activator)